MAQSDSGAHGVGAPVARDHRPVRQVAEPRPPQSLCGDSRPARDAALRPSRRRRPGAGKGGEKGLRRLAPALEAGAVAGGERGRLVEKKELGVAIAPHLAPAALERADADDPAPRRPAPSAQASDRRDAAARRDCPSSRRARRRREIRRTGRRDFAAAGIRAAPVASGLAARRAGCALACASPTVSTP